MAKKPTSVRLQLRELKEKHPEDFEEEDHCILYFINELRYSLVERKSIDDNAKVMSTVTVKDGGKKYPATLMFIGSKDDCNRRMVAMDPSTFKVGRSEHSEDAACEPQHGSKSIKRKEDAIGKDIDRELKKLKKLEKLSSTIIKDTHKDDDDDDDDDHDDDHDHDHDHDHDRDHQYNFGQIKKRANFTTSTADNKWSTVHNNILNQKLDQIIMKVSSIERHLENSASYSEMQTPPSIKQRRLEEDPGESSSPGSSSTSLAPSIMHNDTNLLALHSGGDIKKYALKVFSQLFTPDEMAVGIVEPAREKRTCKVELDPTRINLLKRAIKEKFGESLLTKKWPQIRLSLNQKCLDSKKKVPKLELSKSDD